MDKLIQFRPHHFLCTIAYKGMGYSKGFVANYNRIAHQITSNEDIRIQVVLGLDSICTHCPHQDSHRRACTDENTIKRLDDKHAAILDLKDKEILTFRAAKGRIRVRMSLELFHQACAPCEWKEMGICEDALKKLKKSEQ